MPCHGLAKSLGRSEDVGHTGSSCPVCSYGLLHVAILVLRGKPRHRDIGWFSQSHSQTHLQRAGNVVGLTRKPTVSPQH